MRVLLINHRYFVASGAERYLFNVQRELRRAGHETAPFSIAYSRNEPSEWSGYFTSPIGSDDEVFHSEHSRRLSTIGKSVERLFYSTEVERDLLRMIDAFKPDVAYVMLFRRKLSPAILAALKKCNVPIVVRVSDYNFLCEEHHFLRDGRSCTECLGGGLLPGVVHACVRGSRLVSALNAMATYYQRKRGYFDLIERFVTTNQFLTDLMVKGGFDPNRLVCIPTFPDEAVFKPVTNPKRDYLVFVGRLDRSKGLEALIEAMALLQARGSVVLPLRIVGSPQTAAYADTLRSLVTGRGLDSLVSFAGQVKAEEVPPIVANAEAAIIPSVWFENLPNSYLEAMSSGVPVIASNLGSLASAISNGVDGLLFEPGNAESLAAMMERLLTDNDLAMRLREAGPAKIASEYGVQAHLDRLIALFEELITQELRSHSPGAAIQSSSAKMLADKF